MAVVWVSEEEGRRVFTKKHVPVLVKRCRGRQQARWKASCNRDIESVGLKVEDTMDTREWKGIVLNYSRHPR